MKKIVLGLMAGLIVLALFVGCSGNTYEKAMSLYEEGNFAEAEKIFAKLGDYEDSAEMVKKCRYETAMAFYNEAKFAEAQKIFDELGKYEKSEDMAKACQAELQYQQYSDVIDLLVQDTWYFNESSDLDLSRISFTKKQASFEQVNFDGNGKHLKRQDRVPYIIDDEKITVSLNNGTTLVMRYEMNSNGITLGGKWKYLTEAEVEAGLQGYWRYRDNGTGDVIFDFQIGLESEHNIYINNGKITHESASELYGRDGYGYDKRTVEYVFEMGGFSSNPLTHDIFYTIKDGKPVVLYYDHVCKPSYGLPGKNGYSF